MLRRVLAVAGVVVVLVLLAPAPVVDPVARRVVSGYSSDCAQLTGLRVSSGRWPVVLRALTGGLRDVSVEIDEARFEDFVAYDVSTSVSRVEVAPLGLALVARDAKVRGGETASTVRFEDIETAYAQHGIDLTLGRDGEDGSRLVAEVDVPFVGAVPTTVEIAPVDGDLELTFAPFDFFRLPPLRVASEDPFKVRAVDVHDDGMRIESTFEGTIRADDFGCDVTAE